VFWISEFFEFGKLIQCMPIPVAAWSEAWVCSHLLAEIVGLNPASGTDVCLF
jgi:hypothetical protein